MIASYDRLEDCETVKNEILSTTTSTGKTVFDMICPTTTTTTTAPNPTTTTTSFDMSLDGLEVKTKNLNKPSSLNIYGPVGDGGFRG